MDKKVGVSILFSFLVLVGLIGVTNAVIRSDNYTDSSLGNASMILYGDAAGIDNTSRGAEIANISITWGGDAINVTNITVTWDANFTFLGWVAKGDTAEGSCKGDDGASGCTMDGNATFQNVSLMNGNYADWNCTNLSTTQINCYNNSATGCLGGDNKTIEIRFNVTAVNSVEDKSFWDINVTGDDASTNGTTINAFVDALPPTLIELNISDGNTTWTNGSFNGSSNVGSYLNNNSALTVTATFHEQNPANIFMLYNGSAFNAGDTAQNVTGDLNTSARVAPTTITVGPMAGVAGSKFTHPIMYTWTIPADSVENFGDGGDSNYTLGFGFLANDTSNNNITINDTSGINGPLMPFSIMLNDTLTRINSISFTDARGFNKTGGTGGYVSPTNLTITFAVSGYPLPSSTSSANGSSIYLYYNTTGSMDAQTNGYVASFDEMINLTGTGNTSAMEDNYTRSHPINTVTQYETSINLAGNSTNTVEFYIVLGNKTEDLAEGRAIGRPPANYTMMGGPYSVIVDGANPSSALNTPNNRGITTAESIEYTCSGADDASGISGYTWTLVKPNRDEIVYEKDLITKSTHSKTFSGTDIAVPGTYTVRCKVHDSVGNSYEVSSGSSNDFTVSIASAGGSSGSSSSGGTPAISFDVDFTDSPKATLKAAQGRIKSFSFDGATKHTITFNEVTATTATLIIASDPVTVQLNVGQSKEVDVNNDGVSDMKVTLNSIANNVADITVEKVEAGAEAVKREEREARGLPPTEGGDVTPVAKGGLSGLWWALLVIAAIVVIGYFVSKRK